MFKNKTVEEKKAFKNKVACGIMVGAGIGCAFALGVTIGRQMESVKIDKKNVIQQLIAINSSPIINDYSTTVLVNRSAVGYATRCIETGEIFESQAAAARAYELTPEKVSKNIRGILKHVNGYTFENVIPEQ